MRFISISISHEIQLSKLTNLQAQIPIAPSKFYKRRRNACLNLIFSTTFHNIDSHPRCLYILERGIVKSINREVRAITVIAVHLHLKNLHITYQSDQVNDASNDASQQIRTSWLMFPSYNKIAYKLIRLGKIWGTF